MVLASLAVTAVFVSYSDKLHTRFVQTGLEKLEQLQQQQASARAS
jgi:hypothetical protein